MSTVAPVAKEQVIAALEQVFDPEIPVDVWNFGLIYDVAVDAAGAVKIVMTLTSESCPSAKQIPDDIKKVVARIEGVTTCDVAVVWEPRWNATKISPKGREILGIEDDG